MSQSRNASISFINSSDRKHSKDNDSDVTAVSENEISTIKRVIGIGILISLVIIIAVLVVYFKSPKPPNKMCRYAVKFEAENLINYDSHPNGIAIADLNDDGLNDVVISNSDSNQIGVFLRENIQTFSNQIVYSTGTHSHPYSLTIADFNHDQQFDVAVANFGTNNIGIFLGKGNGSLTFHKIFPLGSSRPRWIDNGDLNNDSFVDLVTVNYGTNTIGIHLGDGQGNFQKQTIYSTGFDSDLFSLKIKDLNNDGNLDIVVSNFGIDNIGIFYGFGDGKFTNQTSLYTGLKSHPYSIVIDDFNHDEHMDIGVTHSGTNQIGIYLGVGNQSFTKATLYSTGNSSSPLSIATGDFNNDNHLDIIVGNYEIPNVGIFYGDGTGSFSDQIIFYTNSNCNPHILITSDFNNDTRLDIAIVNYDYNYLDIVLTHAKYAYRNQHSYKTVGANSQPYSIISADFNNDNYLDLIVGNYWTSDIGVFLGYDGEKFTSQRTFSTGTGSGPRGIAYGDFNNDSKLDIVVANYYVNNIALLFGNADGTFSNRRSFSTGSSSNPWTVAIGDLNNDSQSDIVVTNSGKNTIGIFINYGNGNFSNQRTYATGNNSQPRHVIVTDVNNDQILDILVANYGTRNIGIFLGYGNATFTDQTIYSIGNNSTPSSFACDDFNGDGLIDIGVVDTYNNQLVLFFGYKDGTFLSTSKYSTGRNSQPYDISVSDVNNDKQVDIIVANYQSDNILIFFGYNGGNNFTIPEIYSTGSNSGPFVLMNNDFNKDGLVDIAVVNYDSSNVGIFMGSTNGSFKYETTYSTRGRSIPQSVAVNDLNNDTYMDIVVANYYSNAIDIFFGYENGTFSNPISFSTGSGSAPYFVCIEDCNSDKRLDIIVANYQTNNVGIFFNNGNGTFRNQMTYSTGTKSGPYYIAVNDLNNDTYMDIVVANYLVDNIGIFYGQSNGTFSQQMIYSTGDSSGPQVIVIRDMNNDDCLDIAVVCQYSSSLNLFYGDCNSSYSDQIVYSIGDGLEPNSLALHDLNNDSYLDAVLTTYYGRDVRILFGSSDGTLGNVATYSTGSASRPRFCIIVDWNNDNYLDIIVSNCDTDNIVLFTGNTHGTFSLEQTYSTGNNSCPISMASGYFNDDDLIDIVVANSGTDTIGIFFGYYYMNGIREKTYSTGASSQTRAVALGDFNNDTYLDIVMMNYGLSNVDLLLGNLNSTFSSQTTFSTGSLSYPTSLLVNDLDNDGTLDVAIANSALGNVLIYYGYTNDNFIYSKTYSTGIGSSPQALAIGDFNNDKKLDIAAVNSGTNDVLTLLKSDIGAFRKQITYSTGMGSAPQSVAIADFNKDDHMDFVVANTDSSSISIFLGQGNGSFFDSITYSTGNKSNPGGLMISDLNNDSYRDVIVCNYWGDNVGVFLSFGDGTFSNQITRSTGYNSGPNGVTIGDFNNDNHLDMAVSLVDFNQISILHGYGNGSFSYGRNYSTGGESAPSAIGAADLNRDKFLDIIVANYGTANLYIFQGFGDGTFVHIDILSLGTNAAPNSLVIADFNKDSIVDVAIANGGTDNIRIFFGSANGTFLNQTDLSTGKDSAPYGIAVADFNNDNQLDIAVTNYGYGNFGIFLACVNGTFFNQITYTSGDYSQPWSIAVADLDKDGRLDVTVANAGTDSVGVFFGYALEDYLSAPSYSIGSSSQATSIAVGDFNYDSHLDVVIANNVMNNIMILFGSGYGTFLDKRIYSTGDSSRPCSVTVADLNHDQRLDIIVANSGTDNVGIFFANENRTFADQITYFTGIRSQPNSVVVLDFNKDTHLDIAVANYGSGNINIFLGYGDGNFKNEFIFNTGYRSFPYSLTIGDINKDNFTDIVATNNGFGNIDIIMRTC
ncbi:unnamed protein product [Adineta ricciae]|uniref:Uncharacterized protein n=1 Tax=Adineta ricciae TaxID=249248 RepID=A0A815ZM63_ADIRI|nr:unnamed protein product [Adineta ricciae]CAF1584976.1 unnamed protein product [Adineta ricciae]